MISTTNRTLPLAPPRPHVEAHAAAPGWVDGWVGRPTATRALHGPRLVGRADYGERFTRARVAVTDAALLPDAELRAATAAALLALREAIEDHGSARHPVRFWNFIPGIVDAASGGLDRYMVFNAGRFDAFTQWFGGSRTQADLDAFAARIPTASGVGHSGGDLVIECLADTFAGTAVENPRQQPAYHYSPTYGPLPPCFSRATLIASAAAPGRRHLLIAGTASVYGEDSVHLNDLPGQTDETFENLQALLRAAGGRGLRDLRSLRVYHTRADDAATIPADILRRVPHLAGHIELQHTALCRRNLIIEIEGVAEVG